MPRLALAVLVLFIVSCKPTATPPVVPQPTVVVKPSPSPEPPLPPLVGWPAIQEKRWEIAKTKKEKIHFVDAIGVQINRNKSRYETVSAKTRIPWMAIASIHNMECGLSFRQNLANGDPLTAPTKHVPKGRPPGKPPFSWENAAEDAIFWDKLEQRDWRRLGNVLQTLEAYNGIGVQRYHPEVPSPYLWSWTTISRPGKYVADSRWSSTAVSEQCGIVPILRTLGYGQ